MTGNDTAVAYKNHAVLFCNHMSQCYDAVEYMYHCANVIILFSYEKYMSTPFETLLNLACILQRGQL